MRYEGRHDRRFVRRACGPRHGSGDVGVARGRVRAVGRTGRCAGPRRPAARQLQRGEHAPERRLRACRRGAMASVVVPLLARAALTEPDDGVVYAQRLLSLMVYGLGAVTVAAMVSA